MTSKPQTPGRPGVGALGLKRGAVVPIIIANAPAAQCRQRGERIVEYSVAARTGAPSLLENARWQDAPGLSRGTPHFPPPRGAGPAIDSVVQCLVEFRFLATLLSSRLPLRRRLYCADAGSRKPLDARLYPFQKRPNEPAPRIPPLIISFRDACPGPSLSPKPQRDARKIH